MRIYIAGVDGYLGWALAQHLVDRGHEVAGMDNFLRREWVAEMKSQSATLILPMEKRLSAFREVHGKELPFTEATFAITTPSIMNLKNFSLKLLFISQKCHRPPTA